jgi:hypothetical protein
MYEVHEEEKPERKPECFHASKEELYLSPCFLCETFCNCDLQSEFPDVLLKTCDGKIVRVSSVVVRGSLLLQREFLVYQLLKDECKAKRNKADDESSGGGGGDQNRMIQQISPESQRRMESRRQALMLIPELEKGTRVMSLDSKEDFDSPEDEKKSFPSCAAEDEMDGNGCKTYGGCQSPGILEGEGGDCLFSEAQVETSDLSDSGVLDLIEWEPIKVLDLRRKDGSCSYVITAKIFEMIQYFLTMHIDQVR